MRSIERSTTEIVKLINAFSVVIGLEVSGRNINIWVEFIELSQFVLEMSRRGRETGCVRAISILLRVRLRREWWLFNYVYHFIYDANIQLNFDTERVLTLFRIKVHLITDKIRNFNFYDCVCIICTNVSCVKTLFIICLSWWRREDTFSFFSHIQTKCIRLSCNGILWYTMWAVQTKKYEERFSGQCKINSPPSLPDLFLITFSRKLKLRVQRICTFSSNPTLLSLFDFVLAIFPHFPQFFFLQNYYNYYYPTTAYSRNPKLDVLEELKIDWFFWKFIFDSSRRNERKREKKYFYNPDFGTMQFPYRSFRVSTRTFYVCLGLNRHFEPIFDWYNEILQFTTAMYWLSRRK